MKKILILGGGFGGIATYQALHRFIHPANIHNIHIELISRTNYFTFSPMLHEVATGSVAREHVVQPIREMLVCCGKDFHQATITKIDPKKKIVHTDKGGHSYDVLVVALGVEQGFFNIPGAQEHALALKWLPGAISIRNRIINSFERASELHDEKDKNAMDKFLHFVIVGGGATGTELAGQVSDLIRNEMKKYYSDVPNIHAKVMLIHAGERLLEQLSPKASKEALARLKKMGVKVMLKEQVTEVTDDCVTLSSKMCIPSNSVFWTAGTESVLPSILPSDMLTERGLLKVSPTFQSLEHKEIFGIGDCAQVQEKEFMYPPLAQAAVQASRVVSKNVIAHLIHRDPLTKRYRHKGDIVPIGDGFAIFEKRPFMVTGLSAWLLRRSIFLQTMYGWANRLQVTFDWLVKLFLPRDTSEF